MDRAAPFAAMAERIRHNAESDFGGAVVVVPPGDGEGIETLLLNKESVRNAAAFWSLLKTQIEIVIQEIADRERQGQGYGRR